MAIARLWFILTLFGSLCVNALADGTFFREMPSPTQDVVEIKPTIPFQRAVLKFDGREEIMLVESTLDGPSGTYGWVIPLPTRPSYVKAVNPAYIEQSFGLVKPPIRHADGDPRPLLALATFFAVIVLTSGLRHRKRELGTRVLFFALEAAIAPVLYFIFFANHFFTPTLEDATAAAAMPNSATEKSVDVESLGTIGSYEVSVVSGDTGKPILDWLKDHKLIAGDEAQPIIEAYAKEGWCFLAAEIRKSESGPYPPHPLKAVFDSDRLIYPMRLTGVQDDPLHLELLVVSNREAKVEGMEAWACDNRDLIISVGQMDVRDKEIYSDWRTGQYAMAKQNQVWTYLRGEFEPSKMQKDFGVDWKQMTRYEAEVWDREVAINQAMGIAAVYLAIASLTIGFILVCLKNLTDVKFAFSAILAIALAIYGGSWWYASIKVVDSTYSRNR